MGNLLCFPKNKSHNETRSLPFTIPKWWSQQWPPGKIRISFCFHLWTRHKIDCFQSYSFPRCDTQEQLNKRKKTLKTFITFVYCVYVCQRTTSRCQFSTLWVLGSNSSQQAPLPTEPSLWPSHQYLWNNHHTSHSGSNRQLSWFVPFHHPVLKMQLSDKVPWTRMLHGLLEHFFPQQKHVSSGKQPFVRNCVASVCVTHSLSYIRSTHACPAVHFIADGKQITRLGIHSLKLLCTQAWIHGHNDLLRLKLNHSQGSWRCCCC